MLPKATALIAALSFLGAQTAVAFAQPALIKVSADPFTNTESQHRTEVEPDTVAFGNTIVSAFQTGRVFGGGGADIGWATSHDGGTMWNFGFLPGITKAQNPANRYDAVSDPAVAFDAAHHRWLIASLPLSSTLTSSPAVLISRSSDGVHWYAPIGIAPRTQSADKNWVTCDNAVSSPFYGRCYTEWDEPAAGNLIMMSTSKDGGKTWSSPANTANHDSGIGGQPLVQPNGTVIVPLEGGNGIIAFKSSDGGATWKGAVNVATVFWRGDPAGIRASPLPSASMDASGRIFVAWEDCRFRLNCASNDIVYTTSNDGRFWTAVARVPIDATSSTFDQFDPGFGVQPGTAGTTANIGVTFYYFTNVNCDASTCQLGVGFISSHNGGASWNPAVVLAGPMNVNWLAQSQNGLMVGDYIATSFVGSVAYSVFAVAKQPSGGLLNEAMYAPMGGLAVAKFGPQLTSAFDAPHPEARFIYHWRPLPPKATKAAIRKSIEHD